MHIEGDKLEKLMSEGKQNREDYMRWMDDVRDTTTKLDECREVIRDRNGWRHLIIDVIRCRATSFSTPHHHHIINYPINCCIVMKYSGGCNSRSNKMRQN